MPTPRNHACLAVESTTVDPDRITAVLGLRPHQQWRVGDARRHGGGSYAFHSWQFDLTADPAVHLGTEGLSAALLGLGAEVAESLGAIAALGAEVTVSVVQHVHGPDDDWAKGIHLSAPALAWMVTARAALDIDQYVYPGTGERSDG